MDRKGEERKEDSVGYWVYARLIPHCPDDDYLFSHPLTLPLLASPLFPPFLVSLPSSQLGVPHQSTEDDVYEGLFIPKGSVVFGNVYAIHMDLNLYPDPEVFRPERFYRPGEGMGAADTGRRDQYVISFLT